MHQMICNRIGVDVIGFHPCLGTVKRKKSCFRLATSIKRQVDLLKKVTTGALIISSINHFWGFSWQCELYVGLCVLPLYMYTTQVSCVGTPVGNTCNPSPRASFLKGVKSWACRCSILNCYAWNPSSRTVFLGGVNPEMFLKYIVNVIPMQLFHLFQHGSLAWCKTAMLKEVNPGLVCKYKKYCACAHDKSSRVALFEGGSSGGRYWNSYSNVI